MKPTKTKIALVFLLFLVAGGLWVRAVRHLQNERSNEGTLDGQWARLGVAYNGFDVSTATIPRDEIQSGGPPRDGIPSIDKPKFVPASAASFLQDNDDIVGLNVGAEPRAYPLRILVWHEIVNDLIGDQAVAVTYCPLCATVMVFEREVAGRKLSFGVSGLLYNSDVLMYDRETESLWSQLAMKAVSGPLVGTELKWLAGEQMTWKAWRDRHPKTMVLSTNTGFDRAYFSEGPYAPYHQSPEAMFPVPFARQELPKKTLVLGVIAGKQAKAYPLTELSNQGMVTDQIGERTIHIQYNSEIRHAKVTDHKTGETIPSVQVYWFAWQAFYPETLVGVFFAF